MVKKQDITRCIPFSTSAGGAAWVTILEIQEGKKVKIHAIWVDMSANDCAQVAFMDHKDNQCIIASGNTGDYFSGILGHAVPMEEHDYITVYASGAATITGGIWLTELYQKP
jgi:hypothetical protein